MSTPQQALVNACIDRKIRKLIFVSSVAALHRDADNPMVDPDSTFVRNSLTSDYGWTKHLAEMEVWRGFAEGLSVNVVTPSIILGSGKWNDGSTAIFKNVWQGVPFYPKGGNGFVDVRDVAWLCLKTMLSEKEGERVIASAINLTYRELFGLIAPAMGVKTPRKPLSNAFAKCLHHPSSDQGDSFRSAYDCKASVNHDRAKPVLLPKREIQIAVSTYLQTHRNDHPGDSRTIWRSSKTGI